MADKTKAGENRINGKAPRSESFRGLCVIEDEIRTILSAQEDDAGSTEAEEKHILFQPVDRVHRYPHNPGERGFAEALP